MLDKSLSLVMVIQNVPTDTETIPNISNITISIRLLTPISMVETKFISITLIVNKIDSKMVVLIILLK